MSWRSRRSCVTPGGAWRGGPSGASMGSTLAQEQGAWPLRAGWGPAGRGPSSALATWSSGHCQLPRPCDGSGGARLWSTCRSGRTGSLRGQHRTHTPQQAAGPRVGPGSLLPPGCGRVAPHAGPSGGFPAGRGGHRPSVDSSQRRKPAGVLGARPGSALPSPEPAVSTNPGEDPAAPRRSGALGEGSLPTQATPTPVPSQSSCCPGEVAPQNPGLWTPRRPV